MIDSEKIYWGIVYHALVHAIRTNSGIGFHNNDQGHPAYFHGAETGEGGSGDSPDENWMYKTLAEICRHRDPPDNLPRIDSWKTFCQLAVQGYRDSRTTS